MPPFSPSSTRTRGCRPPRAHTGPRAFARAGPARARRGRPQRRLPLDRARRAGTKPASRDGARRPRGVVPRAAVVPRLEPRADDGGRLQLRQLSPEARPKSRVRSLETCGCADRLDQRWIVEHSRIVDQRRHALTAALDRRHGASGRFARKHHAAPRSVDMVPLSSQ